MKVENLNGYANQFIKIEGGVVYFQSYTSDIAKLTRDSKLFLINEMWDYSVTTRRHFKAFINEYTPFTYESKQQWLKEIESNDLIEVI